MFGCGNESSPQNMDPKSRLIWYIKYEDERSMAQYLKMNRGLIDIMSMRDAQQFTLLQLAVKADNYELVRMLCEFIYKKEDLSDNTIKEQGLITSIDSIV